MARAAPGTSAELRDAIRRISEYHHVDVMNHSQLGRCLDAVKEPLLVYLALPPSLFKPTIETLAARPASGHQNDIGEAVRRKPGFRARPEPIAA